MKPLKLQKVENQKDIFNMCYMNTQCSSKYNN